MGEGKSYGNWGWIVPLIVGIFIAHFFWPTKYEGETAEYWFNAYDGQVAETDEKISCLSDIEVKASSYVVNYEEMQSNLSDIKSMAQGCQ